MTRRAAPAGLPVTEVAAAVVRRGGRFLVTRRPPTKHLGGLWEFPGGKRAPGESLEACLTRELSEELGVRVRIGPRLLVVPWSYPERQVVLHFFECAVGRQAPRSREGQPLRWVTPKELAALPVPPADAALISRLTRAPGTTSPAKPHRHRRPSGPLSRGRAPRARAD